MHAFFGMHSTDKKYDFIAIANRRWRRIDHSRSCHWIGNGRDPVCEPRCLRCNRMCDSMRWRLQSRRFAIKTHLPFWIAPDMHVNFATLRIAQQKWEPERVGHDYVRIRQDRPRPERINKIEKFQPNERARCIETAHAQMFDSVDGFFARQPGRFPRDHRDFVAALNELSRQSKPDFFHSAAHYRRHWKEGTHGDRYFHGAAEGSFRISKSEQTARSI